MMKKVNLIDTDGDVISTHEMGEVPRVGDWIETVAPDDADQRITYRAVRVVWTPDAEPDGLDQPAVANVVVIEVTR